MKSNSLIAHRLLRELTSGPKSERWPARSCKGLCCSALTIIWIVGENRDRQYIAPLSSCNIQAFSSGGRRRGSVDLAEYGCAVALMGVADRPAEAFFRC